MGGAVQSTSVVTGTQVNGGPTASGWFCLTEDGTMPTHQVAMTWRIPPDPYLGVEIDFGASPWPSAVHMRVHWDDGAVLMEATCTAEVALLLATTGTCDALGRNLQRLYQSPPEIAGATFRASDGAYVLELADGRATIAIPGGIGPGITFEAPTTSALVVESDTRGALVDPIDYRAQRDDNATTLWFPGIDDHETITIREP
jgi:hypothetical protein